MKNKTDNQMREKKNTESESHKQKLITEFTPFTGLRLQVPLQWVPIQLIFFLNGTKMVLESTSTTVNMMLYKFFNTSLLEITICLHKENKPTCNREWLTNSICNNFTANFLSSFS